MNAPLCGYDLMAVWYAYADENPEWVDTNTSALFAAVVQRSNELKWKAKFQLPALNTMQRIGIRSPKTYYAALDKLEQAGFITVLERARNQFTACIVQLNASVKFTSAPTEAPTPALSPALSPARETKTNKENNTNKETKEREASKVKSAVTDTALAFPLWAGESFHTAWVALLEGKHWKAKTPNALQISLNKLSRYNEAFAVELINAAIEKGWQGVVYDDTETKWREWKPFLSTATDRPPSPTYEDLRRPDFAQPALQPAFSFKKSA